MELITEYIEGIDPSYQERMKELLTWIVQKYPNLKPEIKWNQLMFTDHGTYIIGFSVSKKHLAAAPESVTITHVESDIVKAGYDYTKEIIRIPWGARVDYSLLEKMIEFNIWDKANCTTFWRK
ncbi:iron chaperone [Halalkalibacter okhensis]|uniref:YdhG-like domain-containing protein n=1 Tax=Halalkalibacter okhensis TaxID=333138 RepID=A0A0B0IEC2_9BACI|nr:iron chaperone [Halalkalibacter okhensis]KHF38031.1 hypothetical protein LQ50_23875 [Halalkalibacter okhensis]